MTPQLLTSKTDSLAGFSEPLGVASRIDSRPCTLRKPNSAEKF